MFCRVKTATLIASFFAILSAPAQSSVVFGAGESYSSPFDFSSDPRQPPYGSVGWELYFNAADSLDVVGGEGVLIEIFDSTGLLVGSENTIETFGSNPSPSLSLGFSTGFDLDVPLTDAVGTIVISAIGQSSFIVDSGFISFRRAFPLSGQTGFLNLADTLVPVSDVPLPAAMYMFFAGMVGLVGMHSKRSAG